MYKKEERWLRGYEKENLADSLVSWDYVFDFLYVTPWTESVRNLSGSKKYVSSVPDCSGRTGVIFCLRRGQHDLVSAHIHAKKTDSQTTVLCVVGKEKVCSLWRCIQYSFIGFFYSGITPSATGGQPVQLYYMNKDGNKGSDCTIVLMTVAVIYKIVLVVLGAGMLLFCGGALKTELQSFFPLYLLGLALNTVAVAVVLAAMLFPQWMIVVWAWVEKQFIRLDIWKANPQRMDKVQTFTGNYRNAVDWLKQHPGKLIVVIAVTFLQRCSVFLLTYMVYLGLGQAGTSIQEVVLLQASVYIAVDMLPLPGAQGITELMYRSVFAPVFSKGSLIPSMLISRGLNFYFLLLAGAGVTAANHFLVKKKI